MCARVWIRAGGCRGWVGDWAANMECMVLHAKQATPGAAGKGQGWGGVGRGDVAPLKRIHQPTLCHSTPLQVFGFPLPQLLKFILATPVQFVIGWRFHVGAYKALRMGRCAPVWACAVRACAALWRRSGSAGCCAALVLRILGVSAKLLSCCSHTPAQGQHGCADFPGNQRLLHLLRDSHHPPPHHGARCAQHCARMAGGLGCSIALRPRHRGPWRHGRLHATHKRSRAACVVRLAVPTL